MFSKIFILFFVFVFHAEFFFYVCYTPVISLLKSVKIFTLNQNLNNLSITNTNKVYFLFFFISLFFWKEANLQLSSVFFFAFIFLFFINSIFDKLIGFKLNSIIYLTIPSFLFALLFLNFIDSFLIFFFFVELYGVLYYFCFLTSYNFSTQTVLKYKNGLLILLWNNFLTTFFLALSCILLLKNYGTTNFIDLNFMLFDFYSIFFFMVGLFWKLGLPIFHFFKLEVYKYLVKENVFLFSILTILINFFLFYIFFSQTIVLFLAYSYKVFLIIIFVSILLLILSLKSFNILQFFALSGIFTLTTILTVFLI